MYKRITNFAIVAVALLIFPLSLSSQNSFSLSLDANSAAGDQAVTSVTVSPDQVVAIQIFGRDIQNANGISVRFEYDAGQVGYDSFDAGNVLPNAVVLPAESGTNPTFVQMSLGALGGQATSNTGLVGTIRFRTTAAFSGTRIRLVRGELGRGGQFERVTLNISVELQSGPAILTPDFDGDGMVGFADFLQFAGVFGSSRGDGTYQARYDLDGDGAIGFSDFLIFTNDFGKSVTPSSGGGGGGGGSSGGTPPTRTPFDLDSNNGDPTGITYANNRFYVVDWLDEKVYAYTSSGQRDSSSDFSLDSNNGNPTGITYANNRFYVVDWLDEKVYAYTSSGQRDSSSDFNLDNNSSQVGITYANNRFYVVDYIVKVYAYTSSGQRDSSSDFNIGGNHNSQAGITYANNRFYMVDYIDEKVYAYTSSGQRDPNEDFNLDSHNSNPTGITYANNRFYVVDGEDDKVYVYLSPEYSGGGGGRPDLIVVLPSVSDGTLTPRQSFTLRATVRNSGTGSSAATTLRYYRSSNATISTSDTEVGTDSVSGLSASDTSDESISLNAPSSAGTYYYGACVDNVSGESDTGNNCSDGVRVTVSSSGVLVGAIRRLTNHWADDYFPSWSPDGRHIAFISTRDGNDEIYVMRSDGSNPRRLTNHWAEDLTPSWSPDGRHIAFHSTRDGNSEIYVMGSDGSNPRRLTNHNAGNALPSWSPDGRHIAFHSGRDGNPEIYVMGSDGSNPRRLTNHWAEDAASSWSPDGRHIAFSSNRDGNYEIYVMGSDGSNLRRLTNHWADDDFPSWSPDGRHIAFTSTRDDGNFGIYVMGSDGSNPRRLTNQSAQDLFSSWSPDGRHIAFSSYRDDNFEIYVIELQGGGN